MVDRAFGDERIARLERNFIERFGGFVEEDGSIRRGGARFSYRRWGGPLVSALDRIDRYRIPGHGEALALELMEEHHWLCTGPSPSLEAPRSLAYFVPQLLSISRAICRAAAPRRKSNGPAAAGPSHKEVQHP